MTKGPGAVSGLDGRFWDVAVVGAGPAGAMVALEVARKGCTVLLVERQTFPRWKVCGACMNGAAQAALAQVGLDRLVRRGRAPRLRELRMTGWGRTASVALLGSVALSREALDHALVQTAVEEGVVFAAGVSAELGPVSDGARSLAVRGDGEEGRIRAGMVVAATGLSGLRASAASGPTPVATVQASSRVGVGAVLEDGGAGYGAGVVHMVVGSAGYVGLVRQEDQRLNVAAAFDTEWVRHHRSPEQAVRAHLEAAGMPGLSKGIHRGWKGTPHLTRRVSSLGDERLFLVGDAAGYVEPFTGEGMAWALWGALALAPLVCAGVARWDPELVHQWNQVHRSRIRGGQRVSGMVAWCLRRPWMAQVALCTLAAVPGIARPLVNYTSAVPYGRKGSPW